LCTLGISIDVARAAFETAKCVVAQINPQMPRTQGDALIHVNDIDYMVEVDEPLQEAKIPDLSETDLAIGKHIADIIEDGATIQMGIGSIPNAVLAALGGHKDLGVHTEMFSDGVIPLVE